MRRKFYGFTSNKDIAKHISQIKTVQDLHQMIHDIQSSKTNSVKVRHGIPGVWAIDAQANNPTERHVFILREVHENLGEFKPRNAATITILENS